MPRMTRSASSSPTSTPTSARRAATRFSLTIPELRLSSLPVLAYSGTADDLPGTRIQDRGIAASPRGRRGGVGPGEIGNLIITGHRTSHGAPFRRLPSVRNGDHILITSRGQVYDYVVTGTMKISFRSERDLARQNAAVPGKPGATPTRAMITLSTCRTPEDRAEGNFWSDELGNPEHRINKIGVLVQTRKAG
jgi:sortase A